MASYGHQMPHQAAPASGARASYVPHMAAAPGVAAPAGTFSPGTKIHVGSHRVVIHKYLSEGGFAHVYLVKMPKPVDGTDMAVLKRVAVPDKEALRAMRTEVETMKRLKGHRMIVTYIDSHASEMKGGGYEVFLLMEYCDGGGLIDFMNTRLQHRLTEPEILDIFADITEGVACMHYLKPPLLHRDLKVENVLITARGSAKRFKLCDFGSAAPPRTAPTSVVECRLMDEDVQKHTTLQYRSPEMVDVYRKQPLNEKSDIWALGVLLYKLCYYTTPFEDQGQLAILNASYKYPSHPIFSARLKKLIASMLRESMSARPNVYQVLKEACAMQGRDVPIKNIYTGRSRSEPRKSERTSSNDHKASPVIGAVFAPPEEEKTVVPDIVPMRRGRPTAPVATSSSAQPSGSDSKTKGDPFAALDARTSRQNELVDDLSSRFPSLDQFSLLHDHGTKFDFDSSPKAGRPQQAPASLNQRLTDRLADDAFASRQQGSSRLNDPSEPVTRVTSQSSTKSAPPRENPLSKVSSAPSKSEVSRAQSIISRNPDLRAISAQSSSRYVSTGTSTADLPDGQKAHVDGNGSQLGYLRSSSLPRGADNRPDVRQSAETRPASNPRVTSLQPPPANDRVTSAPRPVAESEYTEIDLPASASRSRSAAGRQRPVSMSFESSTLDFLRERESSTNPHGRSALPSPRDSPRLQAMSPDNDRLEDGKYSADVGLDNEQFGRSPKLNDTKSWRQDVSTKRSSLTSLSRPRSVLAGKFGDAFKRFEGNTPAASGSGPTAPAPVLTSARRDLTPIAASEATDDLTDDGLMEEDEESLSPEMRREIERRKLLDEEERVERAQAEYRQRVDGSSTTGPAAFPRSIGGVPRAVSIQNRVQSLLKEEHNAPVQRTAEGYGKYSDAAAAVSKAEKVVPQIPRKPLAISKTRGDGSSQAKVAVGLSGRSNTVPLSAPPTTSTKPLGKPAAPKKPMHLNSLPTGGRPMSPAKPTQQPAPVRLVAVDLPGQPALDMTVQEKDDYLQDFSKRFPSLSSIEMVERDIGAEDGSSGR